MLSRVFEIIFQLLGFTHKALHDPPLQLHLQLSHVNTLCQAFPNRMQFLVHLAEHASVTLRMQVPLLGICFPLFVQHFFLIVLEKLGLILSPLGGHLSLSRQT